MPRAMWSGSISFGLVNIPVKLVSAVKNKDIHFHQLEKNSKCRVHQKLYCPGKEEVIDRSEIVKGYEISPDQYVIVKQEEIDSVKPEARRTIDIAAFVDLASIDPIYYDKPYYLIPDEHAEKAYGLFVRAMANSKKVAIAKFVMRNKEYLCALRALQNTICLETMRFHDEVVPVQSITGNRTSGEAGEKELQMAEQLIRALSEDFNPENYKDDYREKLTQMIERKVQGQEIVTEAPEPEVKGRVIDLMAALEASLAKAVQKQTPEKKSRRKKAAAG